MLINLIKKIMNHKPLTEEEKKALEKRDKIRKMGSFLQTSPRRTKNQYIDITGLIRNEKKK